MAIHLLHGCAADYLPGTQRFRNFVSETTLRSYLRALPEKYGTFSAQDGTNVLTIDDATKGAGRAAAIAREYGHRVTLFINPYQVLASQSYYFSLFNACLDNRNVSRVSYRSRDFDLDHDLRSFRLAAKQILSRLEHRAAIRHVAEIGRLLECRCDGVPEHSQTLTIDELMALENIGVTIENHGWSHRRIDCFSEEELHHDVALAGRWLRDQIGVQATQYALPFGETEQPMDCLSKTAETVFFADMNLPPGRLGANLWNRTEITRDIQH